MITGKTKKIGIIGWPVGHSQSPAIQNAAFKAAGLDYVYVPLPVEPEHLEAAVEGLKALDFAGVNVTIPHKVDIMKYLDKLDESATKIGAVNTLVIREGVCIGYNTDGDGFIKALLAKGVNPSGKKVVILGAGGAARAVVCGLLQQAVTSITICARDQEKAMHFLKLFSNSDKVTFCLWQEGTEFSEQLSACDILVNCTSLGMVPKLDSQPFVDWQAVSKTITVCDLVYNPLETVFLKTAAALGHKIVTGDGMLIEQGALAFSLWTGCEAPVPVMYQSFKMPDC
ncbi:shikimate dehydrogenase [Propionispora vibrioides]|uniref:Shikimate dehydrogenase (NADP(+)) n=1 Tax=Propionispora vibrioides TaxID=112903 RepID=A0A1H8P0Z5_9FIRM|nr:shikimate dehydrogenase [Propionispora vibrioides]SEO35293.1 shikimate dehydrogenase [Propionispora vibrioides]